MNDLKATIEEEKKAVGEDHETVLHLVGNLVGLLKEQGKLNESEQLYRRALEGRDRGLGLDRWSTLSLYSRFELLLNDQGRWKEGIEMLRIYLAGAERTYGKHHSKTFNCIQQPWRVTAISGQARGSGDDVLPST